MLHNNEELDIDFIITKNKIFWKLKRFFDICMCFLLLPVLLNITIIIFFLNFLFNKGPVFYIQKRMGRYCNPFYAIKFRTMKEVDTIYRKFSDPVEVERITALGKILRKMRIDELPQILNVIQGDMSLIGPRPDYYDHALLFVENIPNYILRHSIRPGISGLSQIRLGYAEGMVATRKKSNIDIYYIRNTGLSLEVKIFFGTIVTIFKRSGF